MKPWRFIYSGLCDPYTNMAIDEAILLNYSSGRVLPALRIYGWNPPAFSIGYSQKAEEVLDLERCKKEGVLFVRRITGGGIIFHHLEVTYSLTCFKQEINAFGSVKDGFKIICSFLLNTYKKLGLIPHFAIDIKPPALGKSPFCFSSYEDYDIMVGGKKIGGNAQKRKRDLIFQHGSIPLELKTDIFMPYLRNKIDGLEEKVCSLTEALSREITFEELADTIKKSFKETFSIDLIEQGLIPEEEKLALKLKKEKYATDDWNLKR